MKNVYPLCIQFTWSTDEIEAAAVDVSTLSQCALSVVAWEHIHIHAHLCGINSLYSVYNLLKRSWGFVLLLYVGLSMTTGNL